MRRVAVLVVSLTLLMSACGDSSEVSAADVNTFAAKMLDGSKMPIEKAQARCAGKAILPNVSEKTKSAFLGKGKAPLSGLSQSDRKAVAAGMDKCIPFQQLIQGMEKELKTKGDDSGMGDCMMSVVKGSFRSTGEMLMDVADKQGKFRQGLEKCMSTSMKLPADDPTAEMNPPSDTLSPSSSEPAGW